MSERIILPGDDAKGAADSDPTVVLQETAPRDIVETSLADRDAPARELRRQVAEGQEDWGDGFFVEPEPVLVTRNRDGSIARTTPLNEIPGVQYHRGEVDQALLEPKVVEERPTPHPLGLADREKLVSILTRRLFNYYRDRGPGDPRYNPFRDGVPVAPSGSAEHLQPLPGTQLYPASDGEIYDYLVTVVADRAKVINTKRFGGNTIQDIALRIE